jgi:glutaredoxin
MLNMFKLYTKDNCPNCVHIKNVMNNKWREFEELNALDYIDLLVANKQMNMPAIQTEEWIFLTAI